MLVAAVIYGLETGSAYITMDWWDDLANNGMTPEQRGSLDPNSHEYYLRVGGSKTQLVSWSLYVLFLWMLKMSICLFYARLTCVTSLSLATTTSAANTDALSSSAGLPEFELRVKIGYFLILLTWLATQLCILFGCQPGFRSNWQIHPEPPNLCQPAISKLNLYATVSLNVASDAYLMSIPVPMLWQAHRVAPWRRLCLLLVFCAGVIVMACGVMRCYIVLKNPTTGALKAGTWSCRESFLAVLTANAPVIYPAFRVTVARVTSSIFSHHHGSDSGFFPWRSTLSRRINRRRRTGEPRSSSRRSAPASVVMMEGWSGGATGTTGSSVALGTWASCEASGKGVVDGGTEEFRPADERELEAGCWGKGP
ncbi:putative short-chain dehydrogenase reductase sdr protein [Lasiodiplodia theobromae]|nr:putative short-chain dehydrogenase reductase sdr protein [Lasiodiplodia theobromae]